MFKGLLAGDGKSTVAAIFMNLDGATPAGPRPSKTFQAVVVAAVVHHNKFEIGVGLPGQRFHAWLYDRSGPPQDK